MAVNFESKAEGSSTATQDISYTHTITQRSNGMVVIMVLGRTDASSPTITVTVNSVSATQRSFKYQSVSFASIFTLPTPANGNNTVAVHSSVAINTMYACSAYFSNVKQYDTQNTYGTDNGTSDSLSLTVAKSGSAMIDGIGCRVGAQTLSWGGSQVVIYDADHTGDNGTHQGATYKLGVASGTQSMDVSSVLSGNPWSHVAIVLTPSVMGGVLMNML
jgi:hypothetical protein